MTRIGLAMVLAVTLTAEECGMGDFGGMLNQPGTITVTNASGNETAVVAIIADDVTSYPTLASGQSASVQTNVGGKYEVRVVMTPENAAEYRAELTALRKLVEQSLAGSTDTVEKTRLFLDLAGIKAAIQGLETQRGAGCAGRIELSTEEAAAVSASVTWSSTSGSGYWDVICGSS
jgi:hypothetical protein